MNPSTFKSLSRGVLALTDRIGLHREAVSIPLREEGAGSVHVAEGRLVVVAPADRPIERFLEQLPDLLAALDLGGLQRAPAGDDDEDDDDVI